VVSEDLKDSVVDLDFKVTKVEIIFVLDHKVVKVLVCEDFKDHLDHKVRKDYKVMLVMTAIQVIKATMGSKEHEEHKGCNPIWAHKGFLEVKDRKE
jgi:hypothetical protein